MPDDSDPVSLANLFARLNPSRERLEAFVASLSPRELTTPFGDDGWTVKDHLAHLAAWEAGIAALIGGGSRAIRMGLDERTYAAALDSDALNTEIYALWRDQPLPDVLDAFELAHKELLVEVGRLGDTDLIRPVRTFDPTWTGPSGDNPIVAYIAGNTFGHFDEHMEWMAALRT